MSDDEGTIIDIGDDFKLKTGTEKARTARRRVFEIIFARGGEVLAERAVRAADEAEWRREYAARRAAAWRQSEQAAQK